MEYFGVTIGILGVRYAFRVYKRSKKKKKLELVKEKIVENLIEKIENEYNKKNFYTLRVTQILLIE